MSTKPEAEEKLSPLEEARKISTKRAEELTKSHGVKVHPIVFREIHDANKFLIGYMKEPSRLVKAIAMDQTLQGKGFSIGQQICEASLIKEDSDPRIYSDLPENDDYVLGAWSFADDLVVIAIEHSKKK